MQRISVIDTHTGGEPTRVVIAGGPDLGPGPLAQRRELFRQHHDHFRSAVVNEPRGSDVLVGALLVPPTHPDYATGVLFFNNVGVLHMCGHGTIGVAVALGHLGRLSAGRHLFETSVGVVTVDYDGRHGVALENVPSYRHTSRVPVQVEGIGLLHGDIAWGGNWFFLVDVQHIPQAPELRLKHVERLTELAWRIRQALAQQGITGEDKSEIDHIELVGPPVDPRHQARNFVLCPGKAYDRSPCGTGTSAKLACLAADGKLQPGQEWRQESILGSVFVGSYRIEGPHLIPRIAGTAHVNAESTLLLDRDDPFCWGIRS
jgi:4-hydroxyproline epimerase